MILFILLLGTILRLININQSFWLDEAITATIARDLSLQEIINKYLPLDNSPPLYIFLINALFLGLPGNEIVARLPSVLFGLGAVYLVYLIGKNLRDKKFAILSALLLATSPLHIYYSQEGRMYAFGAFLATSLVWFFLRYKDTSKASFLIGYTISGILIIYTHYILSLMLLVSNLLAILFKKFNRTWIFAQGIIAASYIFLLPVFFKQLKLGIEGRGVSEVFDKVLGRFDVKTIPLTFEKFVLGRVPVDFNWTIILIAPPLIFFGYLFVRGFQKAENNTRKILGAWFALPIIFASIISIKIPVFLYYRVLFVLPAFYFLIAIGITSFESKLKKLILVSVVAINVIALYFYYSNPYLQREQWRQAIEWVNQERKGNELILFASGDPWAPYLWYRPSHKAAVGAFEGFYIQDSDQKKVEKLLKDRNKVFVFTYLQDITDPQRNLQNWVYLNDFKRVGQKAFIGVGEIESYER